MDDQPSKHESQEWMQAQQLVSINGDQSRGHIECSRIDRLKPMAWTARPYVSNRIRPTNGGRLHPEAPAEDELLRPLSLQETNPKSALFPLQDITTTPRTGPHIYVGRCPKGH